MANEPIHTTERARLADMSTSELIAEYERMQMLYLTLARLEGGEDAHNTKTEIVDVLYGRYEANDEQALAWFNTGAKSHD